MTSLYDAKITDIIPENLNTDAREEVFAIAVREMYRKVYEFARKSNVYSTLNEQQDKVIDMMANDNRVPYYDENMTLEEKVKMIQNALKWYVFAGKKSAVQELGEKIFGICEVLESWEYGGNPFMFRISVEAEYTQDILANLKKMIERVKPTALTLEGVETVAEISTTAEVANRFTNVTYAQTIEVEEG